MEIKEEIELKKKMFKMVKYIMPKKTDKEVIESYSDTITEIAKDHFKPQRVISDSETKKEFEENTRGMVRYLLCDEASKDAEIVESYVRTFLSGAYELSNTVQETKDNWVKERSDKIELLEKYSMWLSKNSYMDIDWQQEEPYAIDEFLKQLK